MPDAVVLAPVLLAVVLAISAVAKVRDRRSTYSVIVLLRLGPLLTRRWVAAALPWAELALAAALLVAPAGWAATAAAVVVSALMLGYWVIVARALRMHPRPSCGCFGRIGDQRITARTLVRNSVLVALAGLALAMAVSGRSTPSMARDGGSATVWWLLGAAVTAAVAVLVGATPARGPRPSPPEPPGTPDVGDHPLDYVRVPIPSALLIDADGTPRTLRESAATRAQLLVFVDCTCFSTRDAAAAVTRWSRQAPEIDVRMVYSGFSPVRRIGDQDTVWYDHGQVTWQTLDLTTSPSAVLLGADGLLAGGPVGGLDEMREFGATVVQQLAEARGAAEPAETGTDTADLVRSPSTAE